VAYAEKLGYAIKLIGHATRAEDGGVYAAVFPAFLPKSNPLAGIADVFNGIIVKGDDLGEVMFYGRGAGKLPTANAVVADVVDAIKHKKVNIIIKWNEYKEENQSEGKLQKYPYYVRFSGKHIQNLSDCRLVTFDEEEYKNEFAVITEAMTDFEINEFIKMVEFEGCKALGRLRLIGE